MTASRGILFLEIAQIVYAETDGHGCVVHTTSRSYEVNQLLGELEKKLADFGFFRIHKSYLVNKAYIREICRYTAVLSNGIQLPIGKKWYMDLKKCLKERGE